MYDAPVRTNVPDTENSLVLTPENQIGLLKRFSFATTLIWWLSVDYSSRYFLERLRQRTGALSRSHLGHATIGTIRGKYFAFPQRYDSIISRSINLTQSKYAWSFLFLRKGIVASMLTDYTSEAILSLVSSTPERERAHRVAYAPRKGGRLVSELIRMRPDVEWVPIENMSKAQVIETLTASAVYIDLGHHPGKDRIPREAALCGAVVIVARRGSAAFSEDVPLPWAHKVPFGGDFVASANGTLEGVLTDVASARLDQQPFVRWIEGEKLRFDREVQQIFAHGHLGFDNTGFDTV
ncbi:hypothetical protein [Nocardioides sp. Soil777]|uniref:hypothetical protein n=1 Tax=Nocardioides sp. Soil777 TaxID=1736409 RepID=UPI0012F8EA0A|nr:hypothetical protein [Nocardioides sp. Soil777]